MKKTFFFKIAIALTAFVMMGAAQAEMKIVVANMAKIMKEAPQTEMLKRQMDDQFSGVRDSIQADMERLKRDADDYKQNSAIMGESERLSTQRDLRTREMDIKERMLKLREEATLKERQLTNKFFGEVKAIIDSFAAENGYDMIVTEMGVAYVNPAYDVTDALLDRIRSAAN